MRDLKVLFKKVRIKIPVSGPYTYSKFFPLLSSSSVLQSWCYQSLVLLF